MKRNLSIMLAVGVMASTLAVSSAWARTDGQDNGAGCTNNCGNGGTGGVGGTGGTGGSATAGAIGVGVGVGISSVKNDVTNKQMQGQLQGQMQGQMQGIVNSGNSSIKNSGNSTNLNANVGVNKNTNSATTGAIANTNSATGGNIGNITVNAYDPNAAAAAVDAANASASATRDAAASNAAAVSSQPTNFELKTVGVASVPNIYPTSPCMGSTSAGVAFMGGAVSGGSSWKDDDCSYRETARMFDQLGYKNDGLAVMCESAYAKNAPSCKKIAADAAKAEAAAAKAAQPAPAPQAAAVVTPVAVAPQQSDKRKSDATIKSSAAPINSSCSAPAVTKMDGWKFDTAACQWVAA